MALLGRFPMGGRRTGADVTGHSRGVRVRVDRQGARYRRERDRSHDDQRPLTHADLFAALKQATGQLGRKVAPTIYSSKELAKRVKQGNAFVTRVLAQPKLWLIGDERALAA